jgi:hypothetical protein
MKHVTHTPGGNDLKEILDIISTDLFRSIVNSKSMKISQLCSIISLLIKKGIEFDLAFDPATASRDAIAVLTILIRPGVAISIDILFDSGEIFL